MKSSEKLKILVVGDIMLDKYVEGTVDRISPEAPVSIVEVTNEYYTLGGCANVVRNLRELNCEVDCLASIAEDDYGDIIIELLNESGANSLLFINSNQTTVKERIIANPNKIQMLRIDREETNEVKSNIPINILTKANNNKINYDFIIVSDYAKGMITNGLMSFLKSQSKNIIVDPKPKNSSMYNGVYMITPNQKEWAQMMFSSSYTMDHINYILETKGSEGMCLINNQNEQVEEIPTEELKVYNVSGCGDVVVSIMALCLSTGYDPITSAKIANKCAGYTATLPGTSVITKEKFDQYKEEILG